MSQALVINSGRIERVGATTATEKLLVVGGTAAGLDTVAAGVLGLATGTPTATSVEIGVSTSVGATLAGDATLGTVTADSVLVRGSIINSTAGSLPDVDTSLLFLETDDHLLIVDDAAAATAGGSLGIQGGAGGVGTGADGATGGTASLVGGIGGANDGSTDDGGVGGVVTVTGGAGGAATGAGRTAGAGAAVTITAGAGGDSAAFADGGGGDLNLNAGAGGTGGTFQGAGGDVNINAGDAVGAGGSRDGGDITINPGTSGGGGTDGVVNILTDTGLTNGTAMTIGNTTVHPGVNIIGSLDINLAAIGIPLDVTGGTLVNNPSIRVAHNSTSTSTSAEAAVRISSNVAGTTSDPRYSILLDQTTRTEGGVDYGELIQMRINGGATDEVSIFVGDADPDGNVTEGELGSLFLDAANQTLSIKTGASTWVIFTTGGIATLQTAYAAGNTIVVTTGNGDVDISNATDSTDLMQLSRTNTGAGDLIMMDLSPGGETQSGIGIRMTLGSGHTSQGINISNNATANTAAVNVVNGAAATGHAYRAFMSAGTTGNAFHITDGTDTTTLNLAALNASQNFAVTTDDQATADTAGFNVSIDPGDGGVASAVLGGTGGRVLATAGVGGAGVAGFGAGIGGDVSINGGLGGAGVDSGSGIGGAVALTGGAGAAADTSSAGIGGSSSLAGGAGGAATLAISGATGGSSGAIGGSGGAGTATGTAGSGGPINIAGGVGGSDGGGGGAVGGAVDINGGVGSGGSADGAINIGTVSTGAIGIGNATDDPTITALGSLVLTSTSVQNPLASLSSASESDTTANYAESLRLASTGTGAEVASIIVGDVSPDGDVLAGSAGSLYLKASGTGEVYVKTDNTSAWSLLASGAGNSLQAAYVAGNTITVTTANGSVTMSNSADVTDVLTLSRSFAGAGNLIDATMGATTTDDAITILMTSGAAGDAVSIGDGTDTTRLNLADLRASLNFTIITDDQAAGGGVGNNLSITAGSGGDEAAAAGAAGGQVSVTTGAGGTGAGAANPGGAGGAGGIVGGVGGTSALDQGGDGGDITNRGGVGAAVLAAGTFAGAGGNSTIIGGTGGASASTLAGGGGGQGILTGGIGGANTGGTGTSGAGGNVVITGGAAGADNTGTGAAGGDVTIAGGAPTGALVQGSITFDALDSASPIPFNETGDVDLDVGFTATSIIGALNELLTGGISGNVSVTVLAGEAIQAGSPVSLDNTGGTAEAFEGDANSGDNRENAFGIAPVLIADAATGETVIAGEVDIPDAAWAAAEGGTPAVGDVGSLFFLAIEQGHCALDAPSVDGSRVLKLGIISRGGSGAVRVIVPVPDSVKL